MSPTELRSSDILRAADDAYAASMARRLGCMQWLLAQVKEARAYNDERLEEMAWACYQSAASILQRQTLASIEENGRDMTAILQVSREAARNAAK